MSDKTINPLGTQPIGRLMVRYTVPSIISLMVNSLYNMVDQVFIGQGVGYIGNTATNVIMPLATILMALGMMIGDGTASFMSLSLGRGDVRSASRGAGHAISLSVGVGVVLLVLFELFMEPLCVLFGATEGSMPYALQYGRIIVLGFVFSIVDCAFGSIIRADGRPNASMIGLLIGCITNMILDPVFIFVFNWGVAGAAWATITGQFLNAVYFVLCISCPRTLKFQKQDFFPTWSITAKLCSLGTSSFISQAASVLVLAVMNNSMVHYGGLSKYGEDIPLAALGITIKVSLLITSISLGISSGVQPILGFNYGSGQHDRVKKTFRLSLVSSTIILAMAFVIFQVWPEQIISIFGQESELYVEFAVKCFRIYLGACFMIGFSGVIGIFFQAIGHPVPAALISLSRQVIFLVPAVLTLGYLFGVEGILWAGPFSDTLSALVAIVAAAVTWKRIFYKHGGTGMNNTIITIGRQYGSGGREIGEKLAERLGWNYYDTLILEKASESSGITPSVMKRYDEQLADKWLTPATTHGADKDHLPLAMRSALAQFEVIHKIGQEENAVIVGRCADYVLREQDNILTTFIHAEWKHRVARVAARNGISPAEAEMRIRNTDKHRAAYYNYYSDRKWGNSSTYRLCIDSSLFGITDTVELLVLCAKRFMAGDPEVEKV